MNERFTATETMRPVDEPTASDLRLKGLDDRYAAESALWPGHGAVRVDDYWLALDMDEGWTVALRLMPHEGQAVIGELRIFPTDEFKGQEPGEWRAQFLGVAAWRDVSTRVRKGITARLLRRVPLGAHLKYAHDMITEFGQSAYAWKDLSGRGLYSESRSKRSNRRTDAFYAQVAVDYVGQFRAGSRRPVADMASRRGVEASVIRDAVHEARERGFLTMGTPGKPGGVLTEKASEVLRSSKRATLKKERKR